jgi:hypothetical protein
MIGMTVATTAWCMTRHGLGWPGGTALIAVYVAFMLVILLH